MGQFMEAGLVGHRVDRIDRDAALSGEAQAITVRAVKDCPAEIMKGKRRSLKFLTSRARAAIETRRRYYEWLGCVRPSTFMFGKLDGAGYWEGETHRIS